MRKTKRALLLIGALALFCPMGCNTTEPVIWSWPLNKRRLRKISDDFHQVHMDFNRIVFDMENYPVEVDY